MIKCWWHEISVNLHLIMVEESLFLEYILELCSCRVSQDNRWIDAASAVLHTLLGYCSEERAELEGSLVLFHNIVQSQTLSSDRKKEIAGTRG